MTDSLVSVDYLYLVIVIIWLIYYTIRLLQHARNPVFLKMPWLILWLNGYVFGLCYVLNNYWAQTVLEQAIQFTDFPVTIILKLSAYMFVFFMFYFALRYYSPYHKSWYRELLLSISWLGSCLFIAVLWEHGYSFTELFWFGDICLAFNSTLALLLLIRIIQRIAKQPIPTMEYIHYLWFFGCVIFAGISLNFTTLSAFHGLFTNRVIVQDQLLQIGYISYAISLMCMMVLTSPDTFIYRMGYPLRLLQIKRLNRLYYEILWRASLSERYPLTPYKIGRSTESAIYERVISILDIYPFLDADFALFQTIQEIESKSKSYLDCAEALMHVKVPDPVVS